ncbi:FecR family protein [Chitinophaga qingshengii]|uniref:FecR domain-containing protein n=1 Tax=Chitinophaga qingshengii TaxID=1569794 RepID=A0ABR7TV01_9BACT|nr:FecR domain-containing protein [Chitinophaga qingshengii]MBC9932784.1 FecR domain-containing protein [Chitinophaga qingshengii]
MSTQDRLTYLLRQALQHVASDSEMEELLALIREDHSGTITRQVETLLLQELPDNATAGYDAAYWDGIAGKILTADKPEMAGDTVIPIRSSRRRWLPAAAAAVLLLAVGAYWLLKPAARRPEIIASAPVKQDVAPGGNKAVLILADGSTISLDSTASGALTQQGNTHITQPAGGQLIYSAAGAEPGTMVQYNTLRTPRGGQFQVTLPDGTKVWLNAASSLKYPVAFKGATRQVELTGEAYFDVAQQAATPFKVAVHTGKDSLEVAVLGTQFNIMAYTDENMVKTTLLEGAVKVNSHGKSQQLAPGQGAYLDKRQNLLALQPHVNTEEAVAWKNGYLQLEGNDIASVMRMISRWYNVDVVFKSPVPAHFRGIIPRNVPVSQVLKILEMTGEVHFEISGRQIIVSP